MAQEQETIFREIQRFRQPWFWFLLVSACISLLGVVSYAMVRQLALGRPVGHSPISDTMLLVLGSLLVLLILGFPALIASVRLVTEVRLDGLYFGMLPFQRALFMVGPKQLKAFEMRAFKSVAELRIWKDKTLERGNILTVSGNYGVHLEMNTGENWFVGSQRPDQLLQAIVLAFKIPRCKRGFEPRTDTDKQGLEQESEAGRANID